MVDWKLAFQEAMVQGSVDGMVVALQSQATTHAGTAPAKIKSSAITLLRSVTVDKRYPLVLGLCQHSSPSAQEIGAICLTDFYPSESQMVNPVLYELADSAHWEVREWVASACGVLLERHFQDYLPVMKEWSRDTSENVRRAVVLAVMYAGKSRNPEFAEAFLDLLEPLLADQSKYVRDNLGPFALGAALIKYYPDEVLTRVETWAADEDEQVRWNVAMIFASAEGAKFAHERKSVLDVLHVLAGDERPYVKRAVAKAMKKLQVTTV